MALFLLAVDPSKIAGITELPVIASSTARPEESVKAVKAFVRDSSDFINIYRKKVAISSDLDSLFVSECPSGYGFYSTKSKDCSIYKKCEKWNKKFAFVTLNKCNDGKMFNFDEFICVSAELVKCDSDSPTFVST